MSRYASRFNKRDEVEPDGIEALAKLGVEWVEAGPLDGWIWLGQWIPVEWKSGKRKPLTQGQKDFIAQCNRTERPYRLWRTPLEAIESVQEWRRRSPINWPIGMKSLDEAISPVVKLSREEMLERFPAP